MYMADVWYICGLKKTTLYLPDHLKRRVESIARIKGTSEADVIRDAIVDAVRAEARPAPRVPLTQRGLGDPSIAERVDELLDRFGQ